MGCAQWTAVHEQQQRTLLLPQSTTRLLLPHQQQQQQCSIDHVLGRLPYLQYV